MRKALKNMHEFLTGPLDDPLQLPSLSNFESFFLLKAFGTYATLTYYYYASIASESVK